MHWGEIAGLFIFSATIGSSSWFLTRTIARFIDDKRKRSSKDRMDKLPETKDPSSKLGPIQEIVVENNSEEIRKCFSSKVDYLADCPGLVGKYVIIYELGTVSPLSQGIVLSEQISREEKGLVYELYLYAGDYINIFRHNTWEDNTRYAIETSSGEYKSPALLTDIRQAVKKYCSSQCIVECSKECILKKFKNNV